MPWLNTGAILYHVDLGLLDKGRSIKELVVCMTFDRVNMHMFGSDLHQINTSWCTPSWYPYVRGTHPLFISFQVFVFYA